MKRYLACFLALILLLGCACAEEPEYGFFLNGTKEARELRSDLQSRYLVSVRIGDECLGVPTDGFEVNVYPDVMGFYPAILSLNARYEELVRQLEEDLSVYSPYFFYLFFPKGAYERGGISFMLVNHLMFKEHNVAGMFAPDGNWLRIWLSANSYGNWTVHHEMWHAIETKICREDPDAFSDWSKLNPEGFVYSRDVSLMDGVNAQRDVTDWFGREYGMYDGREDRATVFEAIVTKDDEWWSSRPQLQKKAEYLREKIRSHFVYWPFAEE
ncbi:MAG: hypothetical protein IKG87_14790 [Clostridia bacterium]|nr:hypothetical protein [Clostridia bacterium]